MTARPKVIVALENGPLLVDGPVVWRDAAGHERRVSGKRVALCRCGASANKPFCDGTHKQIGFQAPAGQMLLPDDA